MPARHAADGRGNDADALDGVAHRRRGLFTLAGKAHDQPPARVLEHPGQAAAQAARRE